MAGLVPAIHAFDATTKKDVDARHKAGHDESSVEAGYSELVMKTCIVMCAAAMALGLEAGHAFSPKSSALTRPPRADLTLVQDSNGRFRGIGVVTDIDAETGALTVKHQEIKGLMPAMEMLFRVNPRSLSDGVKAGDRIEFSVEDKTYTIRDLKVIEHAK